MSAARFQFDLVSPEKKILSKQVVFAAIPSEDGYVGVLEGHSPYVFALAPGLVDVFENDQTTATDRFFIVGGFAEVTPTTTSVLAESVTPLADLDPKAIEEEISDLEEDYALAEDEEKRDAIDVLLNIARSKLESAKQKS